MYIENLLLIVCNTTAGTDSVPIIASHQNRQIDMNCARKTIGKRVLFYKHAGIVLQHSYLLLSAVFSQDFHENALKGNFSGIYKFLEHASDLRERSLCRYYLASQHHVIWWPKFNSTWIVHYKYHQDYHRLRTRRS